MRSKGRPILNYSEEDKIEIKKAYKKSHNLKERNRLLCVKLRVVQSMTSLQISKIVDFSIGTIDQIISSYNRNGIEAIKAKTQTAHSRNMAPDQAHALLDPFRQQAVA